MPGDSKISIDLKVKIMVYNRIINKRQKIQSEGGESCPYKLLMIWEKKFESKR